MLESRINFVGGAGGNGIPNEQGSNGGHGGTGLFIINPLVLNFYNFPSGGRGKFAGNGGDGGTGGKEELHEYLAT